MTSSGVLAGLNTWWLVAFCAVYLECHLEYLKLVKGLKYTSTGISLCTPLQLLISREKKLHGRTLTVLPSPTARLKDFCIGTQGYTCKLIT